MTDSIERAAQRIYLAHMFGTMMPNLSDVIVAYNDDAEQIIVSVYSRLDGNKLDARVYVCNITSDDAEYTFNLESNPYCYVRIPLAE